HWALPAPTKARLPVETAPELLAVAYIRGYRQSAIMVSGSLISPMVLTPIIALVGAKLGAPLFPETKAMIIDMTASQIWSRYVRYIGAGAVAAAGIVAVARSLPTMWTSFAAVLRGLRGGGTQMADGETTPRTDRDLPSWVVLVVPALVIITLVAVPGLLAGNMNVSQRLVAAIGVAIFGVAFVVVSSRIVGLIGVSSNPTSAMTLVTLLGVSVIFVFLGWTDPSARAAILTVGTVVCIAASKAGDISQDLKTGFLLGATPARQQLGQFIGGIARRMVDSRRGAKASDSDPGVLAASGMIAGEGLVGVLIALIVAVSRNSPSMSSALSSMHFGAKDFTWLKGAPAIGGGIIIVLAICALLYVAATSGDAPEGTDAERASVEAK